MKGQQLLLAILMVRGIFPDFYLHPVALSGTVLQYATPKKITARTIRRNMEQKRFGNNIKFN